MLYLSTSSTMTLFAILVIFKDCTGSSAPQPSRFLQRSDPKFDIGQALQTQLSIIASNHSAEGGGTPCHQSSVNSCPLSDMAPNTSHIVYPEGAKAKCIEGPFAFQVQRGDDDKLLIFFEGGGACTGPAAGGLNVCTKDIADGGVARLTGFFNKSDVRNPLRSYTIVNIAYCGGDAFIGNVSAGPHGDQFGYFHAEMALTWALNNFNRTLSSLVVSGESAGALGTQFWARHILQTFKYTRAAVLADSYAGVLEQKATMAVLGSWNSCNLPLWTPELKARCHAGTITEADVFNEVMELFPCVRFGSLQSKADNVQRLFYCGTLPNLVGECLSVFSSAHLYAQANAFFEKYNNRSNYVGYFVNGDQHTFTELPIFYSASPVGADQAPHAGQSRLYDWVGRFVGFETVSTECDGPLMDASASNGVQYCDKHLMPKTLGPQGFCI